MNGPTFPVSTGVDDGGHYWVCGECGHKNYSEIPWTSELVCEECKTVNEL